MNVHHDYIQQIISLLKPLDAYSFITTCKSLHAKYNIKQNLINEINHRLSDIFGDKLNAFKELMKNTCSVISGSFLIQCLLDEYWENSDIDIYIPMKENNIYQPTKHMSYIKSDVDNFMFYMMSFHGSHSNYEGEISDYIKYVRTYYPSKIVEIMEDGSIRNTFDNEKSKNSHYNVQIIGLDIDKTYPSVKSFIDETFDFTICKNVYYYNGTDNVALSNLHEIFTRETNFISTRYLSSSIQRYHKYKQKGNITFKNKHTLTYNEIKDINKTMEIHLHHTSIHQQIITDFFKDGAIIHVCSCECNGMYKCGTHYCIIHFIDENIKHTHFSANDLDHQCIFIY